MASSIKSKYINIFKEIIIVLDLYPFVSRKPVFTNAFISLAALEPGKAVSVHQAVNVVLRWLK